MNSVARTYPEIVRDLLTHLTQGVVREEFQIGIEVPELIPLRRVPVDRVSYLEGTLERDAEAAAENGDEEPARYRFTERDFELVRIEQDPQGPTAIRLAERVRLAPFSNLIVNYYPVHLPPTSLTETAVGGVARTLIETISRELAVQYQQLQIVYESAFLESATGSSLDKVVALVDTPRLRQGHAVGRVRFSRRVGSPGSVFIPANVAVTDGRGTRYLTSTTATLQPNQGSVEVLVHGESVRTETVDAGVLEVPERLIAGIDHVTNPEATFRATDGETDEALRLRARGAIHGTGKGTRDAIRFGLEALPGVRSVGLREHPDPSVVAPGVLRVDVALKEDTESTRRRVDRRLEELRPAGIFVDRHFSNGVSVAFDVELELAGAGLEPAEEAAVKSGVVSRVVTLASDQRADQPLRRSRLVAVVLEDPRVADARVTTLVDGAVISADSWTAEAGTAPQLASPDPVTISALSYELAGEALAVIQVDATLEVAEVTVEIATLEVQLRAALETLLGSLSAGASPDFDVFAVALRDDQKFALVRSASVVVLDQQDQGFTELRDDGAAFVVPPNTTFVVRDIVIQETGS